VNMRKDVLPAVLAEHVMQPEQRQPEEGDAEQRRPWRDPVNCVWNGQAAYRIRAPLMPGPVAPPHFLSDAARVRLERVDLFTKGYPRMSSATDGRQASMDATQIYREETFTDRRVGTIRRLTPVTADGATGRRAPRDFRGASPGHDSYGAPVPISFELDSPDSGRSDRKIRRCGRASGAQTMRELQEDAPRAGVLVGHS